MKALFDSDIFAYRAASACEDEDEATAQRTLDRLIVDVLMCGVDNIYPDCFVDSWSMHLTEEADDTIAIEATKLGDNCVIVSLDKDLDQIVGWHYNFVKHLGYYIKPEEALVKLYTQMLTGDAADNIKGLFRVGPVKAAKIIGDTTDELELYNKVLEAYEGDAERVLENAQLLFLRRYEGQIWTPPQT